MKDGTSTRPTLKREPTFAQWLFFHRDDHGVAGEVARYAAEDACWPRRAKTVTHFIDHLRAHHAGQRGIPMELTLREAFDAYREFLRSGAPLPSRQGNRHGRQTERTHKYLSVADITSARLADLTNSAKRPDRKRFLPGEVVDIAVAREHARVFRQKPARS